MTDRQYLRQMTALLAWLNKLDPMDQDDVLEWDKALEEMRILNAVWLRTRKFSNRQWILQLLILVFLFALVILEITC